MSNLEKNTVSAQAQVQNNVEIVQRGGTYKVLFVGNSITRHAPKPEIGWFGDWGMAASAKNKDYVHLVVKYLEERLSAIDYAIVNCATWERQYYEKTPCEWATARNFGADVIVVRLGENMWNAKDAFFTIPVRGLSLRSKKKVSRIDARIFPNPMGSSDGSTQQKSTGQFLCFFAGDPYGTRSLLINR